MKRFSVLIIDDDESAHEVLGEYLELAGFRVLHARDGAAGLQVMEELRPDLALLDVNMPVMDGFKTMEVIGKDRKLRDIPVLFLTSLDRFNLKIKGLELGAEDYIVKPYNKAELLARINAALRRGERYRRNEAAMEGNLADISLAELLQTLDIGRKTACIHLKEIAGSLCVEKGSIVFATFRDFTGQEAVMRLFFLEKGAFTVSFDALPEEVSGQPQPIPIQRALFETVTYIDELRAMLHSVTEENSLVEIRDTGMQELDNLRRLSPVKIYDLLVLMSGNLKENMTVITGLLKNKTLALVE
ncbi:MAG: response regulator [Thermodesulfovibrionales bacterium]